MDEMAAKLLEELNVKTAFTIPIFGGIAVAESVVITWVVMAFILLLSIFLTRNMKVHNIGRRQLVAETIVTSLNKMVSGMVGKEGTAYIPYLATVLVFIGISNLTGLFGLKPPTKDLNVTAALAILSILLIEYAGIRQKGMRKWLRSFKEPTPVVTPINILEVFVKPLSLCMRLFGNILGGYVVMELIKLMVPVILPIPFSFYFDVFDGLIQAYVFVFLTSLFIKEAIE